MSTPVNLNDATLADWAELDQFSACAREATLRRLGKLTEADLDAADRRRTHSAFQRSGTQHLHRVDSARLAAPGPVAPAPSRTWWHRIERLVRIGWLRWEISSTEQWVRYAARDGVFDSVSLRYMHRHLEALRVRLAVARAS